MSYRKFKDFISDYFSVPIQKLPVDGGFTCPNRDGFLGVSGCSFCNNDGFSPRYTRKLSLDIVSQLEKGKEFFSKKHSKANKYLAYFQSYSNTYAPLDILKERYKEALSVKDVEGLIIGTRPDCISEGILDYLAEIARNKFILLEYGIESVYDNILKDIKRGHDYASSVKAIDLTHQRGIPIGIHIILGLPGVTREDDLAQVYMINKLPINVLKLHQLQILRGTSMYRDYLSCPAKYNLFDADEYAILVSKWINALRKDIAIDRLVSEVPSELLVAPKWGLKPIEVEQKVMKLLDIK